MITAKIADCYFLSDYYPQVMHFDQETDALEKGIFNIRSFFNS